MENLNRNFFDEYTRLDNLCRQIFNSDRGVSSYIEAMETTPYSKYRDIPDWSSDLKMLKQYRHIRNELAHSPGAFHRENCVLYDITWIKLFYRRIVEQRDPLAMLFKSQKKTSSFKSIGGTKKGSTKKGKKQSKKSSGDLMRIFSWSAALILIILLIKFIF